MFEDEHCGKLSLGEGMDKGKDYFVQDLYACADHDFKLNVRIINEYYA